MPTKVITCERCDGTGRAVHPNKIEDLRTRIENIKTAMSENDAAKLQANLDPKPPARLRPRPFRHANRKDPLGGGRVQAQGRDALPGLAAWVKDLEAQQNPCEHCLGSGEIQHRTLGWEIIEGVVAVGADGTEAAKASRSWRCRVPGGWMVKTTTSHNNGIGVALTFVPDPDHSWEP